MSTCILNIFLWWWKVWYANNQWSQPTFNFLFQLLMLWIKEYFYSTPMFSIDGLTLYLLLVDVEIATLVGCGVGCWWHIRPSKSNIGNVNVGVTLGMNVKVLIWKLWFQFFILVLNFLIIFIEVNGILWCKACWSIDGIHFIHKVVNMRGLANRSITQEFLHHFIHLSIELLGQLKCCFITRILIGHVISHYALF
jgi:hypothetical protein